MAIQFPCSSCGKLIEVDDELAGRLALCPYCQGTAQVPARSAPTTHADADPPSTSPPPPPFMRPDDGPFFPPVSPTPLRGNGFGNGGLALSLLAWGTLMVMVVWMIGEVTGSMNLGGTTQPSSEELQQAIQRYIEDPDRSGKIVLLGLFAVLFAAAGVALSIIGLTRRDARKGTAIAGVVLGGTLLACQCVGMLIQ